ncbi:MAG: hypothetical protein WA982_17615 [Rubrobacteraceae bacterium]
MGEGGCNEDLYVTRSGVLAASILESACISALKSDASLQLEVVRSLANDLKSFLEETSQTNAQGIQTSDLLAEAALRCADLANLAACNVYQLSKEHRSQAVAAVHLASGAVKAINVLAEAKVSPETPNTGHLLRDLQSAGWRADLAVRQV